MISLDKAEKLNELGISWEPHKGDFYYHDNNLSIVNEGMVRVTNVMKEQLVFAPRLDQLLPEIEQRYFMWSIYQVGFSKGKYLCTISEIVNDDNLSGEEKFYNDNLDDAVADALISILS